MKVEIDLPDVCIEDLKRRADKQHISVKEWIEHTIEQYVLIRLCGKVNGNKK